jgi:hypothetical protein
LGERISGSSTHSRADGLNALGTFTISVNARSGSRVIDPVARPAGKDAPGGRFIAVRPAGGTMCRVDVVVVHGAGMAGAEAWPHQAAVAEAGWFFMPRAGAADSAPRALLPPWGIGLQTYRGLSARTLVITGGWSPLYEETAKSLAASGARHLILEGAGHRIQDDPQATQLLREHWSE